MALTRNQWRQEALDAKAALDTATTALSAAIQAESTARIAVRAARDAYETAKNRMDAIRQARTLSTGDTDV